jgi:hypothetical protein
MLFFSVFKRVASLFLLMGWLFASGAMLDVTQVVAWSRMFSANMKTDTVIEAVENTFHTGKMCSLCKAVAKAREATKREAAQSNTLEVQKLILIVEDAQTFKSVREVASWSFIDHVTHYSHSEEIPVPPPRAA